MTAGLRPEDGSWARDTLRFGSGGREEARMNEGGPQFCARPDASLPAPPVAALPTTTVKPLLTRSNGVSIDLWTSPHRVGRWTFQP
ncbi:hypothetical protein HPB50_025224 [Hyalomma asiaticum]|uniref:Uncharacterized protein n=2 Tax=Hyalomma asiaticum TaxID=266040 RepID=A0ACB7RSW8_HYAAI|nr:hypothetical protein HPB50_019428 [Hyalomma asiaticum]KAH6948603.1 hypothetical protein HPB50_025224 [Hyalomma asiaticum]